MIRGIRSKTKGWITSLLAPAADPRQTFAYSYDRQRELLLRVQEALKHVRVAKTRLEAKTSEVRGKLPDLQDQARRCLIKGDEVGARAALERRTFASAELESLESQLTEVEAEEQRLTLVENRISSQIDAFFAQQEVIEARYNAAEAKVRIQEALTGLSDELVELSNALLQTQQKTELMQTRAFAIDQLVEEGALGPGGSKLLEVPPTDPRFEAALGTVASQLESLKQEVGKAEKTSGSEG